MSKMTVDLSAKLDKIVSELAEEQEVPKAQVVRRALALLSYLQDESNNGGQVLIRNGDTEKEVIFHSVL